MFMTVLEHNVSNRRRMLKYTKKKKKKKKKEAETMLYQEQLCFSTKQFDLKHQFSEKRTTIKSS